MKIAVCIKQVPVSRCSSFDNETRRVVREVCRTRSTRTTVCRCRLQCDSRGSMLGRLRAGRRGRCAHYWGRHRRPTRLLQALAMGADRAVHLNDRVFAGSDTLATSTRTRAGPRTRAARPRHLRTQQHRRRDRAGSGRRSPKYSGYRRSRRCRSST